MSIEISVRVTGECTCGTPQSPEDQPSTCVHEWVCKWGVIEHGEPRPDRNQVGHLMLTNHDYVGELLHNGPLNSRHHGVFNSVTEESGQLFAHVEYEGKRWTWELHDAHWADVPYEGLMIGVWPERKDG